MASTTTNFLQATPPRLTLPSINGRNGKKSVVNFMIKAAGAHDHEEDVDKNMIALKMRIKKMKKSAGGEASSSSSSSSDWNEWEKKVFSRQYEEGVCECIEMLQSYLLKTRPSVALGVMTLIAMALPLSSSVVMINFMKLAKGLLAGCHLSIDIDF